MITEPYDALKEAGASEGSARKAAETMADQESRFAKFEATLANTATKTDLAETKGEIIRMDVRHDRFPDDRHLGGRHRAHAFGPLGVGRARGMASFLAREAMRPN
jgi:hypothetical protein